MCIAFAENENVFSYALAAEVPKAARVQMNEGNKVHGRK